ncbi:MYND finger family protein isoform X2 [Zea mays]|uniref:MYND-type domain-containing protein n=1 Tax=Zea mays TaxID=4577 RepID=A0A804UEC7_MAIZE|nr:MYND finger family protein isoform X2 [Zea mays]
MECAAKGLAAEPCAGGVADRRCGGCGAVAYCSRVHQIIHWRVHKEECERFAEQMRHINALSQFPFTFLEPPALNHEFPSARCLFLQSIKLHQKGLWKSECICGRDVAPLKGLSVEAEWNLQSSLCPCAEPKNPVSSALASWEAYYQWRSLPLHSPVAVLLHWPLTLYHCVQLSRTQTPRYDGQDTLCIHYLGPEKELLQLAAFGELRALFPSVQIHIELVGPEVPKSRDGEVVNISRYACCSDKSCCCKSSIGSKDLSCTAVTLKLWKGFYHERCSDILKEMIRQTGIPAIFTDFCEEAAHLASCCISSITGQPLKIPIQVNPFRQPVAAENNALYVPCYSNCFVFGM